jgi:hypothetical protein
MERTADIGAGADPGGLHIEARLDTTGPAPGHHVDITVYGPGDALRGSGWVTTLSGSGGFTGRSLFSQRGSEKSGVVRLTGVTLYSSDPRDVDAWVTTEADVSSGVVRLTVESLNGTPVQLEGTGTAAATRKKHS